MATTVAAVAVLAVGTQFVGTAPALGPDNIPASRPCGVTAQWPSSYFAAGCAMHLSHLYLDLQTWYGSLRYSDRVKRMFLLRTAVPAN